MSCSTLAMTQVDADTQAWSWTGAVVGADRAVRATFSHAGHVGPSARAMDARFHQWHIAQKTSMDAYQQAIRRVVSPGDVVLDLGAGTGGLGFDACRAGASRVYAVEGSAMAALIPVLAKENGLGGRVVVVPEWSFDTTTAERGDVVIASMLDAFGVNANLLAVVIDARHRLLHTGARIIPSAVTLACAPAQAPEWYAAHVDCWNGARAGYSFATGRRVAANTLWPVDIDPTWFLAAPKDVCELSMRAIEEPRFASEMTFLVERAGVVHGIAGWFRATLAPGVTIGNSPGDPSRLRWKQVILPVAPPLPVAAGDSVKVTIRMDAPRHSTTWTWRVETFGRGVVRQAHREHSTFHARLFDLAALAKPSPSSA